MASSSICGNAAQFVETIRLQNLRLNERHKVGEILPAVQILSILRFAPNGCSRFYDRQQKGGRQSPAIREF